jgi:hypothetical protein
MLRADHVPQRSEKRAVAGSVIEPEEPERHEKLPQVYHFGGPVHFRVKAGAGEADNRKDPTALYIYAGRDEKDIIKPMAVVR